MEILIENGKLNVQLKKGDKILSEARLIGKKTYTFKYISKDNEYHLENDKCRDIVVGMNWFHNKDKRTFLLGDE